MAPKASFALEQAAPEEATKVFFEWANSESWNPTRGSTEIEQVCLKVDPSSFWFGKYTDENDQKKLVSIISAIKYGKHGWIGFNICNAAYRGRGFGLQGFTETLNTFPPGTSVGLDAVMSQVDNYKKSGFVHYAWTNERRHGSIDDLLTKVPVDEQLLAARIVDASKLSQSQAVQLGNLETEATGLERDEFATRWVGYHNGTEHRFSVAYLSEDGQTVLGYGCVRPAVSSYRVGPLYAQSPEVANAILVSLGRRVLKAREEGVLEGVKPVFDIDVPDKNKAAIELFNRLGWPNTFPCARMWYGSGVPKSNPDHAYAICTLEVG
ncbi:hypothetical protein BGW42_000420 [Actinomortierella wolfii]|nr:hypothetical protein BGW42_000420 [Actinomortierella wolfii]